jgi:hypothetical protein
MISFARHSYVATVMRECLPMDAHRPRHLPHGRAVDNEAQAVEIDQE